MRSTLATWSLLSLLSFSVLAPGCAGPRLTAPGQEQLALARIAELGGTLERDPALPSSPVVKVDLHASKVTDADLSLLAGFAELRTLDLRLTSVGDEGLARLASLRQLRFVNLFRTKVGDAAIVHLAGNRQLETLLLGGTRVTDQGLSALQFPLLKKLSLFDTEVGDPGLRHLYSLKQLERLLLGKSKATEAGMKAIGDALPALRFAEPIG